MKLATQPYKGSRDFYPEDQKLQNYIFEKWRQVCQLYGFQEYNGPFLELFDLYAAKSGQELVEQQLYSFDDRSGRKVAIRPEMTPTVARMVAQRSKSTTKPLKWFSIANFWRYENPQKGRLREFFQLNADVFGPSSVLSDFEVFSLGAAIMESLGATEKMYEIRVNNRLFMDFLFDSVAGLNPPQKFKVLKAVDKKSKMTSDKFNQLLIEDCGLDKNQTQKILEVTSFDLKNVEKYKGKNRGADEILEFFNLAENGPFEKIFVFDPEIVRGLDYYTGLVIEQWDKNPQNNRSMYGGGRYDNLTELFEGAEPLPATGFAMGDVTLIEFLKSWQLLPNFSPETQVLVTVFADFQKEALAVAHKLRSWNLKTELYLSPGEALDKQIAYANKKQIPHVVIIGEKETKENKITVKDLRTGEQKLTTLDDIRFDISPADSPASPSLGGPTRRVDD